MPQAQVRGKESRPVHQRQKPGQQIDAEQSYGLLVSCLDPNENDQSLNENGLVEFSQKLFV